jgi:predicted O-linked N-acetylglucosamine transferase (SPINDLY family)
MANVNYDGSINGDDYIAWMKRAYEGTRPAQFNISFDTDTGFFRKIRVGFISYDFRAHSVGKFAMSVFDVIKDNTGIETYCYYTFPDYEDNFTGVFKERADVFKFVGRYSDKQLRKELLDDNLDILIDLNGNTAGTKLPLLAERFAPIQCTWMGFPFSCHTYNIDYTFGDYHMDPIDNSTELYLTEKVLRLDSWMCFALTSDFVIEWEPPQTYNGYVTFGMMSTPSKYSEETIRLWQVALDAVPHSRILLQLSHYQGEFIENKLRERLEKYGLDLTRVDFGRDYGQNGYWSTYNKVDVMLDTVPFAGGTTSAEAVWMGVPILVYRHVMRQGRASYSLMANAGLDYISADTKEGYAELAANISQDVELLRELRMNLRERLRDTPAYNRNVFRDVLENRIRDTYIDYCLKNKKPFEPSVYYNDDGQLLRDCVRAADIVVREINRESENDKNRLMALLCEYTSIHSLMLERMFEIYGNDSEALSLALKAAELFELLSKTNEPEMVLAIIKNIRMIFTQFA